MWAKWPSSASSLQAGTQPTAAAWHRTRHWQPGAVLLKGSDNKSLLDFHMSKATFQFFCKELTYLIIAKDCPSARRNWCAQGNCYRFWIPAVKWECQFLPHRGGDKIAKGCQGKWDWSLFRDFGKFLHLEIVKNKQTNKPLKSISDNPWIECKTELQE